MQPRGRVFVEVKSLQHLGAKDEGKLQVSDAAYDAAGDDEEDEDDDYALRESYSRAWCDTRSPEVKSTPLQNKTAPITCCLLFFIHT